MLHILLFWVFILCYDVSWAKEVSFKTADNATIYATYQVRGAHAVLLAHGAIFNKESWGKFEQNLLEENFTVLAIDFRGYNKSTQGDKPQALYEDILAGVNYLRQQQHVKQVTVLGASMGGMAAAKANVRSVTHRMDGLILLSPAKVAKAERLKGQLLFIASQNEYLAKAINIAYAKAPEPKTLLFIEGKAHAQHIFKTPEAEILSHKIIDFLKRH